MGRLRLASAVKISRTIFRMSSRSVLMSLLLLLLLLPSLRFARAAAFFSSLSSATATLLSLTTTPPQQCKILILPGFGNNSEDYTMPDSLVDSLKNRGWSEGQIQVLPVQRTDWLQVFLRGIFDPKFWLADAAPTRAAFSWYLERISEQVSRLQEDETIIIVGHSAGGWLGRAALGFGSTEDKAPRVELGKISGIVTLGAPNLPPPPGYMDMTRGALRITNERFPGSYHAPDLFYITVVGSAIRGQKQERKSPLEPTSITGFAFNSYEAVCGDGTTVGDGVVPLCAAHVDGAVQLTLENVLHSINAPSQWYGADGVIDQWHDVMLKELARSTDRSSRVSSPVDLFFLKN